MAIFALNELGGREELLDFAVRTTAPDSPFDRVKSLEARLGRIEMKLTLNRRFEVHCDMSIDEALRVAERLVELAEEAEGQRAEIERAEAQASERIMKRRSVARAAPAKGGDPIT